MWCNYKTFIKSSQVDLVYFICIEFDAFYMYSRLWWIFLFSDCLANERVIVIHYQNYLSLLLIYFICYLFVTVLDSKSKIYLFLLLKIRQGCQIFLRNFIQVFWISSRFSKVHVFGSILILKINLRLKTGLSSIIVLER